MARRTKGVAGMERMFTNCFRNLGKQPGQRSGTVAICIDKPFTPEAELLHEWLLLLPETRDTADKVSGYGDTEEPGVAPSMFFVPLTGGA